MPRVPGRAGACPDGTRGGPAGHVPILMRRWRRGRRWRTGSGRRCGGARDRRTGARRDLPVTESLRAHAGGYPDLLGSFSVIRAQ